MNNIRTIIVDDETPARKGIRKLLEKDSRIKIITECQNGDEAIRQINFHKPDLVFLDIQMPGADGFEVLRKLDLSDPPQIVFVTAFEQYAIKAFEADALDYLLKPYSDDRFKKTLERAITKIRKTDISAFGEKLSIFLQNYKSGAEKTGGKDYLSKIMINEKGKYLFVDAEDIVFIEAMEYYARIHTVNTEYLLRESMHKLEVSFNPEIFFRVHKSFIVNIEYVKAIKKKDTGDFTVILSTGNKVKMSRNRKKILNHFIP